MPVSICHSCLHENESICNMPLSQFRSVHGTVSIWSGSHLCGQPRVANGDDEGLSCGNASRNGNPKQARVGSPLAKPPVLPSCPPTAGNWVGGKPVSHMTGWTQQGTNHIVPDACGSLIATLVVAVVPIDMSGIPGGACSCSLIRYVGIPGRILY